MPLDEQFWTRDAMTRPNSYNPETRTVSAVIATATPVPRRDARGPFLEVLTADTLDLSAAEGLPVLDSHRTASQPPSFDVTTQGLISSSDGGHLRFHLSCYNSNKHTLCLVPTACIYVCAPFVSLGLL